MNSVVGLITEYNPFHNGHLYHLNTSKKITKSNISVAVMSGNFVQRGEPSIFDKWTRTKMALANGVDIVIELPVAYSIRSAEFFSFGAIKILDSCGIINNICFGSEIGDIKKLNNIAEILLKEPPYFKDSLKQFLNQGYVYPKALHSALNQYLFSLNEQDSSEAILQNPNNILGIEYLKSLKKLKSNILPYTITRKGSHFHDKELNHSLSSATGIRLCLMKNPDDVSKIKNFLPLETYNIVKEIFSDAKDFISLKNYEEILFYLFQFQSDETLRNIYDVSEGLEYRIISSFLKSASIEELISEIKTKRYSLARIHRILTHLLLHITKEDLVKFDLEDGPQYIRILGFSKKGQSMLSEIKKKSKLPIVTNAGKFLKTCTPIQKKMLEMDIRASNIYWTLQKNKSSANMNSDFRHPIIYNSP